MLICVHFRKYTGTELPDFVEANNLKPFTNNDVVPVLTPHQARTNPQHFR